MLFDAQINYCFAEGKYDAVSSGSHHQPILDPNKSLIRLSVGTNFGATDPILSLFILNKNSK
jgi:hypothetical protein